MLDLPGFHAAGVAGEANGAAPEPWRTAACGARALRAPGTAHLTGDGAGAQEMILSLHSPRLDLSGSAGKTWRSFKGPPRSLRRKGWDLGSGRHSLRHLTKETAAGGHQRDAREGGGSGAGPLEFGFGALLV